MQISSELEARPAEANNRTRLGDWEGDTVAGKAGKACLVTYVDRHSRFLKSRKIAVKKSEEVKNATIDLLKGEPLNTITPDRGKEFSKHAEISEELDQAVFCFPKPAHPLGSGKQRKLEQIDKRIPPKRGGYNRYF